jgi:hypothetical protein
LEGANVTWWVVGGWAVDLFLGEQTRDHQDLEIAVLRKDFPAVRHQLRSMEFFAAGDGQILSLANEAEVPEDFHQRWVLEPESGKWRLDVMLQPGDGEEWIVRRDESITAPRASMVSLSADGIPYELPHGVLLYKAKAARSKDEADFAACLPRMSAADRRWLALALSQVHSGHEWIRALN